MDTGTGSLVPADPALGMQPVTHHLAHPDTKRRLNELINASGLIDHLIPIRPVAASEEDILRAHSAECIAEVKTASALPRGGNVGDHFTMLGRGGFEIAMLSAGGAIELVKKVVTGEVDTGYALINPPGHHAVRAHSMGFCFFNNSAIAAAYARALLGIERIVILDFDVHHGNGTQDIWWEDPSVFTISIHQHLNFPPNSGFSTERGRGKGLGYNLNVPLPPAAGNAAYIEAFEKIIIPAIEAYRPQLIIVGAGYDANIMDPLSRTMVRVDGFRKLARMVIDCAGRTQARLAFIQEGGYSPHYVPFCGHAVIEELAGVSTLSVEDPYHEGLKTWGGDVLLDNERACIEQMAPILDDILQRCGSNEVRS